MPEPSTLTYKRYAICVGINTYAPSSELHSLRFAEHDAQAMDEAFGTLGFEQDNRVLLLGEQATLAAINEALNEMTDRAEENDLVVFYFAGHGVPLYFEKDDTRDVFLASYDFDPQQLEQRRSLRTRDALGMERLRREYFEGQGSRKRLFLFDSCYSGEFAGFRSGGEQAVQQHMQKMLDSKSTGRVALLSCLPEQVAVETVKHGHGRFTYYLLQALQGKAPQALRRDGWLIVNTLFEYLSQQLPEAQRPVLSGIQHDVFEIVCYPEFVRPLSEQTSALPRTSPTLEKEAYVRAMLADHSDFLRDRLESFVGREQEVAELQQRIADKMPTGGYVIITSQAGQGKSSIMAKLVDGYGREQVPFHFIPFNPGPDHQVGLLRNLMARLVLKYQLSDIYVSAENRAMLRDYFPNVLREVAAKGGQEIIFIDGLDQIEEDMNGVRDLSFLPTNPPAGIVFVLATRPDDALRPLVLLKPHEQYQLPNLQREDFDLILQHRSVILERHMVDRFYQAMDENALYLDLVAKELHGNPGLSPQELMVNIANNPDNVFTLAITRFKQQPLEWREVIKPMLGVLFASREPLAVWHLQHILDLDGDRVRDGIMRLGGLLRESEQHCYSLFHLKLQEYLCQDERRPEKDFVFTADDVEQWHDTFVTWCEHGSLTHIWEDTQNTREQGRRAYARYHYIEHLYAARQYEKLFQVLDDGIYGKEKGRYDQTNRLYMQDLILGQWAAINYGKEIDNDITAFPFLWKYTLLRGSLRIRVDHYPESLFRAMLHLHREKEVIGLIELITDHQKRITIVNLLGLHYVEDSKQAEGMQMFLWAISIAQHMEHTSARASALCAIAEALAQAQQWEQAAEIAGQAIVVAREIDDAYYHAKAMIGMAKVLAQAQRWKQMVVVVREFKGAYDRTIVLCWIAEALVQMQQRDQAVALARQAVALARRIDDVSARARVLRGIAKVLARAQQWEQAATIAGQVIAEAREIKSVSDRSHTLREIAEVLVLVQQWEQAVVVARQAVGVAREIEDPYDCVYALCGIAEALVQAQQWEQAAKIAGQTIAVAREIDDASDRVGALSEIAKVMVQAQQWEQATAIAGQAAEIARKIKDPYARAGALNGMAEVMVQVQQWEQAAIVMKQTEAAIMRMRNASNHARALNGIAKVMAQAQQWEQATEMAGQATEIAREIEDVSARIRALRRIAEVSVQAQQRKQATAIAGEAAEVARKIKDPYNYVETLSGIAKVLAQAQQWEQAAAIAEQTRAVAWEIENTSNRAEALSEVAKTFVQAQQWEQATMLAKQAADVYREIDDLYNLTRSLREIAEDMLLEQQGDQAIALVKQAATVARWIEDASDRVRALSEIAKMLARVQQWEQAVKIAGQTIVVAREIEDASARAGALREIAEVWALVQQWEQAVAVTEEIKSAYHRVYALCGIARVLAQVQQWEQAAAIAGQATVVVGEIERASDRAYALSRIAEALVQAQQWEQAVAIAGQAAVVAGEIKDASARARVLSGIVEMLVQVQQWEQAAALAGQTEAVTWEIERASTRVDVLLVIANAFAHMNDLHALIALIQRAWLTVETREYAFKLFPLIHGLIEKNPHLGISLAETFAQVDTFLHE
ncbi:caspase family protein [Dictyobacter formicarum]|uniref:Peptidase C14 caspase domain-containing protein n=1 Tax=Dictyobacter formicarum TaxID=2778368 RepID=A0ABQ3VTD2_9CHLR|nr:caspase family protein [Dictyobacter formicarum]GHO89137.1 hypothetical protein KSZ_71430 [Dictyobacter formicarum]